MGILGNKVEEDSWYLEECMPCEHYSLSRIATALTQQPWTDCHNINSYREEAGMLRVVS